MSKHYWTVPKPDSKDLLLCAELGWDRAMQVYYCNILVLRDMGLYYSEGDEPLYSYFSEKFNKPLQHYLDVCKDYGIEIPEEIVNALEVDRECNRVNEDIHWN